MRASIKAREANKLDVDGIMDSTGQAIRALIPAPAEAEVKQEIGARPHIPPFKVCFYQLIIISWMRRNPKTFTISMILLLPRYWPRFLSKIS